MTKQSSEPRLFVVGYPRIPNEGGDWRMHGPWRDLKDTFPDARVFMDPLTCNATVTFACEDDLHDALKQRRRWRYTERDRYYDVHATEKPRAIGLLTLRGKIPRYAIKELKEKLGIPDLPWAHICFKEDEILIYFNEGAEPEYAAAKDIRSVEIEGYTFDVRVSHDFESEMLVESSSNSRRREGPNEGSWRKPYPGSPTDHRRSSDLAPYSRNRGNDSGGTIGKMRSSHSSSELANNTDRASLTFVFKPSRKEPSLGGFSGVPPGSSASSWRHSSSAAAFRQDSSATSHSPLSPSSSAPARLREDFEQYKRQSVAQMRELNARIDTLRVERDEAEAAKCRLERKLKLFEDLYREELLEKQVYRNHVYDVRRALGGLLDRLPSSSKDDEIMDDKEPEPYQQQPQEPQPPPPPPPPPPQQQEGPEPEPVPQNNTAARAV